jgi:hypothetical protein
MALRTLAQFLLLLLVSVTLFGLPLSLPNLTHYNHHCPLTGEEMPLCATVLEHIDHWQTAFASVVATFILLAAFVYIARTLQFSFLRTLAKVRRRSYLHFHPPDRPTLFQELFSQGLLNPKIPYSF